MYTIATSTPTWETRPFRASDPVVNLHAFLAGRIVWYDASEPTLRASRETLARSPDRVRRMRVIFVVLFCEATEKFGGSWSCGVPRSRACGACPIRLRQQS